MFSTSVKHMSSSGRILATRVMGAADGTVKPVRKHYDLATSYTIHEENGSAATTVQALFPSGKYDALNYTPAWSHHRFCGWYESAATPTTSVPSGTAISPSDKIVYGRSDVYARWQLPATVNFDATTNGGQMPPDWSSPDYYVGQPYGILPKPTHPTLNFTGWYDGNTLATTESAVPSTPKTLVARYAAQSYTVDLNNGQWREQSPNTNPNVSEYDGVYESNSNYNISNGYAKMYIRIIGYTQFTVYIRSYAESNYDYTIAFNPDVDVSSNPSYSTSGVKAHTRGTQRSGTSIGDYTQVTYTGLDGGSHYILVVYRKDGSVNSNSDRGYVLIPRVQ